MVIPLQMDYLVNRMNKKSRINLSMKPKIKRMKVRYTKSQTNRLNRSQQLLLLMRKLKLHNKKFRKLNSLMRLKEHAKTMN